MDSTKYTLEKIKSRDTPSTTRYRALNSLRSNGRFSILPSEDEETNKLALGFRRGVCIWLNVP